MYYHTLTPEKSIEKLNSSITNGLNNVEAEKRLKQIGPNLLSIERELPLWRIIISEFTDPVILLLFANILILFLINNYLEIFILILILLFKIIFSITQKYRLEKIYLNIHQNSKSKIYVIRDGQSIKVSSYSLVPGDIIQLNNGDIIPADCRLLVAEDLKVNESILVGDANSVEKNTEILTIETPLAERKNTLFLGSYILYGNAIAIVTDTGVNTELGKISKNVHSNHKSITDLQKRLISFSKKIIFFVLIFNIVLLTVGLIIGKDIYQTMQLAISLTISVLSPSFSLIVLICFIEGSYLLLRKKIIIKNISSLEKLSRISVICLDKTGTITENVQSVKKIISPDQKEFTLDTSDYSPNGKFFFQNNAITPIEYPYLDLILTAGALCNDSAIKKDENNQWSASGDSMESALIAAAAKADLDPDKLAKDYPREMTIPFQPGQNFMATLHYNQEQDKRFVFLKGSPEAIINLCSYRLMDDKTVKLNNKDKNELLQKISQLAEVSYRPIALAYKEAPGKGDYVLDDTTLKYGLVYMGVMALNDPIRTTALDTFKLSQKAGLNVIMITGDHPNTAINIAKSLGQKISQENILTGEQFEKISDAEYHSIAETIKIYARTTPEQKIRILDYWQQKGEMVAATGDEIDDIPVLKKADIGIAKADGAEICKEFAEIILQDNDFSRIVTTIKQSRIIFENIQKCISHALFQYAVLFGLIAGSFVLGIPLPITATQIIWVSVIYFAFMSMTFSFQFGEKNIMHFSPRKTNEKFFDKDLIRKIIILGVINIIILLIEYKYFLSNFNLEYSRSIIFTQFAFFSIFNVYSFQNLRTKISIKSIFYNQILVYISLICFLLQILIIYIPSISNIFNIIPLSLSHLSLVIIISFSILLFAELEKNIKNIKFGNK